MSAADHQGLYPGGCCTASAGRRGRWCRAGRPARRAAPRWRRSGRLVPVAASSSPALRPSSSVIDCTSTSRSALASVSLAPLPSRQAWASAIGIGPHRVAVLLELARDDGAYADPLGRARSTHPRRARARSLAFPSFGSAAKASPSPRDVSAISSSVKAPCSACHSSRNRSSACGILRWSSASSAAESPTHEAWPSPPRRTTQYSVFPDLVGRPADPLVEVGIKGNAQPDLHPSILWQDSLSQRDYPGARFPGAFAP